MASLKTPIRILYLDNQPDYEELIQHYLEKEGIDVDILRIENRAEFLAALLTSRYDLILLDSQPEDMGAIEAISLIRHEDSATPVILLPNNLEEDLLVTAIQNGADDIVCKNNISRIGLSINKALGITSKNRPLKAQSEYKLSNVNEVIELHDQHKHDLENKHTYIKAIVENLDDGLITLDTNSIIKTINPAITKIFGYDENELIGQGLKILMPDPYHSKHDGFIEKYINSGKSKVIGIVRQVQGRRKNGETFPIDVRVSETKTNNEHYFIGVIRDITESVSIEEQLKRSQIRYEHSLNFANIGTWDWNIQTNELYWSERIAPLFGYPQGELDTTFENFINSVHPDDRQKVNDAINACIETGTEYNIEHRCVWPDGSVRWLHEKGDVERDKDGNPVNMLGVVHDITDRKLAEETLAVNAALLKEAQQIGKIGNWSHNYVTGEFRWSDEIYRILGYEPGEFNPSYERFFDAVHPDDVEKIKHSEKESFDHNQPHSIDHRIVLPGGEIRWVHGEAQRVSDENNKTLKLSGTLQDITERKFNEQKLILTNEILQQIASSDEIDNILNNVISGVEKLLDGAICSILMLGDDNKLYNRANNRLPDYYNQAIEGAEIGEGIGSCETAAFRNSRVIVEDIFSHPYWEGATELARKANIASCWSQPVRSHTNKPLGTFAIYHQQPKSPGMQELDLIYTAAQLVSVALLRERHENSLTKARDDAERANKAKSEFLSQMSHELRTPLNAIIGFSQLLEMDKSLNDDQVKDISEIYTAGNHLLGLINEILDLSKIETGNIEIDTQEVSLCCIIDECISLTNNAATRKNISIEKLCPPKAIIINADKRRLKQSILNLLSNAVKYNKENGSIIVTYTKHDHRVQVDFKDTGCGISKKHMEDLFTPFNRLHAENSNIEGTGIGLVITRQLVELMGGTIDVKSEEGAGSTFSLSFELVDKPPEESGHANQNNGYRDDKVRGHKTVVYIEDNEVNLKVVKKSFKTYTNVNLLSAMEPEEGIDLITRSKPDLILLDINLPQMSGYEVIKILKQDPATAKIPVIAVSASAMTSDLEKGRKAGFDNYITKPINLAIFYDVLDKYLL